MHKRDQMCYLVRINDFDNGTIFHIVKKNSRVDTAPAQPFPSKTPVQARATAPGDAVNPDRSSARNTTANIEGGLSHVATREEIKQLHQQGITVNDDNEPVPENVQPPVPGAAPPPGTWEKRQNCCRRSNLDFADQAGKFVHRRWDKIADMDELQLFRMCFPKKWIVDLVIPETNKTLSKPMDL